MRKDGFYHVRWKDSKYETGEWTVGQFTSKNKDGKLKTYPWKIIASDEIFKEQEFAEIDERQIIRGATNA